MKRSYVRHVSSYNDRGVVVIFHDVTGQQNGL